MRKGFTLVELAIVLVIIGLLIGGILVAQSMIKTAKIQAFARQVGSFDAAVVTFIDRYGNLPGDSNAFNPSVGNSNGLIETSADDHYDGEAANFWLQLQQSGLKKEEGSGSYGTGHVAGTDYPRAKIGAKAAGFWAFGDATPTSINMSTPANMYIVADCGAMSSDTPACSGALYVVDALAIDKKLDDGVGDNGNVQGIYEDNRSVMSEITQVGSEGYNMAITGENAIILLIRMGNSTGDLK